MTKRQNSVLVRDRVGSNWQPLTPAPKELRAFEDLFGTKWPSPGTGLVIREITINPGEFVSVGFIAAGTVDVVRALKNVAELEPKTDVLLEVSLSINEGQFEGALAFAKGRDTGADEPHCEAQIRVNKPANSVIVDLHLGQHYYYNWRHTGKKAVPFAIGFQAGG